MKLRQNHLILGVEVSTDNGEIIYKPFGACAELDSVMAGLKPGTPSPYKSFYSEITLMADRRDLSFL
jgi:hypothetical protein